jgi:hypothetical protein
MPEEQIERSQPVEQGAEKKALSTPDAQAARNASAADVNEVQSTNPNNFESMTKLPTIKDGMSLESAQAEFESFGIEMGDNTTVTAAGVEAPAMKRKISVDPRPSYVEGLKAIGNDEEAQGKYSIEYMERKEREALAALQQPPVEQVLIASNITPAAPNLEQMQQFDDVQSDSVEGTVAWEPNDLQKWASDRVKDAQKTVESLDPQRALFVHRGHEDQQIDYKTAFAAFHVAHLDQNSGVTDKLIPSALRNEQYWYKSHDKEQDDEVRKTGTVRDKQGKEDACASIGPAQIQIQNIRHLINATDTNGKLLYPFLEQMKNDPLKAAEDPRNAALLAGAYFADKAKVLTALHIPVNDKTLSYCWNPDVFLQGGKYVSPDPGQLFVENHAGLHKSRQVENVLNAHREPVPYPIDPQITGLSHHVKNVMANYPFVEKHK